MSHGNFAIHVCAWLIGLPIGLLLIVTLARGAYKRYPMLLLFAIASVIMTLLEIVPYYQAFRRADTYLDGLAAGVYWVEVWTLQILAFAVIINLLYEAAGMVRRQRLARIVLFSFTVLFPGITFAILYGGPAMYLQYWMMPWARNLDFCAGILDLLLLAGLIAARHVDRRLLVIAGAFGVQFIGEAIGDALRKMSARTQPKFFLPGVAVWILADVACLFMCWWALRPAAETSAAPQRQMARAVQH